PIAQRRSLLSQIDSAKEIQLPVATMPGISQPQRAHLSSAHFAQYLTQENPNPALDKVYVWGTSLMVDEIEIDGFVYPMRQYNPEIFAIRESGGIGSCPYVYARSSKTEVWRRQGHILYGFSSSYKEATDEIELRDFD